MKAIRKTLRVLAIILILLSFFIGLFDQTHYSKMPFYKGMLQDINTLSVKSSQGDSSFQVGWAKANITPHFPVKLVGYRPRGPHTGVHDSLFVNVMVVDNGHLQSAIISIDLLIFPPLLRKELTKRLPNIGWTIEQTYLSATHTHTGFGGWDDSPVGGILMGGYQPEVIDLLCNQILTALQEADRKKTSSKLSYIEISVPNLIENRLDKASNSDSLIRVIQVEQKGGQKGLFLSFSAHATNINKSIHQLSGDYPSEWIKQLEENEEIDFAFYCAGMVGSHRSKQTKQQDFEKTRYLGKRLADLTLAQLNKAQPIAAPAQIMLTRLPIQLPDSQMRLAKYLKIYDWAFDWLMGELEAEISILQLGNLVLLGMPCDFSGELYIDHQLESSFTEKGLQPLITSFNGFYVGYITADEHQDVKSKEEVRIMSWVGPHKGAYFSEIIKKLANKW